MLLQFLNQRRVLFAHLLIGAKFLQLHVQFEDSFQQVCGDDLFLLSSLARFFSSRFRLPFEFYALELQQIFSAADWIFESAISIVQT